LEGSWLESQASICPRPRGWNRQYIFGIGRPSSAKILETAKGGQAHRVRISPEDEVARIVRPSGRIQGRGDLRKDVSQDIKHSWTSGVTAAFATAAAYRRGQREHERARARAKGAVAGKKKATKK
jgi:small subunit ribosomal protein S13